MHSGGFRPKIGEKRWAPKNEVKLLELWEKDGLYRFNPNSGKPIVIIDTPPPYASGKWHVGGAAHYAQIDMVARSLRMRGYEVLFPFGVDRNGLPVEVQVEKKYGVKAHEIERVKFEELCRMFLDEVEVQLINIAKRLGLSCDFENYYRTDSPEYRKLTQATFIELWHKGLIYEAEYPVNWCPSCRTSIADAEVEYEEVNALLVYMKFRVKGSDETILVASTRPELLCTCSAVIYNPGDSRYTHLEGKTAIVPINGREVPILSHPYAKPEFGSGLVMVCSYGDKADIQLFRELGLKPIIAVNLDGKMNENAGKYAGLYVKEARNKIIEDLRSMGLIERVEAIRHKTPICWRSKDPIEFVYVKEYYLKQLDFLDDIRKIIDKMKFYPERGRQLLLDWVSSISIDWPISRRRFYATEIPIWYCKNCGKPNLPEPGKYYKPWNEKPPFERCQYCGSLEFEGEWRTFDTWIDSSISPLYISWYGRNDEMFKKVFQLVLRPQGYEIIRTWLYYTILRVYQLLGSPAFTWVRISGMGLDEKGEAMHKSKGNVVDPEPVIEQYGADAFRFWASSEVKLGSDYRYSEDKVKSAWLFITKLWNVARFISCFPQVDKPVKLEPLDQWVLAEVNRLLEICLKDFENFDFFEASNGIRFFLWHIFADHYLEAVKPRAYNKNGVFDLEAQHSAWYTLHTTLKTVLRLLAPICPFITDVLWRELYGGTVHFEKMPTKAPVDDKLINLTSILVEFNSSIWKLKKRLKIPLSAPLKGTIYAPKELEVFSEDLKLMHGLERLEFTPPPVQAEHIGGSTYYHQF
ncbi:MAG: valine--tRNA ligase [Candidatus Bathyarchaeia archaeon]